MRWICRLPVVMSVLLLLAGMAHAQAPGYESDPKFQKAEAEAKERRTPPNFRVGAWKKANKIAGGACLQCLLEMAQLQYRMGDLKGVFGSTTDLEARANLAVTKSSAEALRGLALFHANRDRPKPEQLEAAVKDFNAALMNDPKQHTAGYMKGRALAMLQRDEEARQAFLQFAAEAPETNLFRRRAEHFAANPALARAPMAPPFTVTTAEGKEFTLDSMGGRVVLVDFWATWCGPCNQELPHIKKIAQEFAGQPFVLISVSWDSDQAKWSEFVQKNGMTWNQYRDADHSLSEAYGVQAIPHYFTIDADGVLEAEKIGSGADIEGKLKKLVGKAREQQVAHTGSEGGAS